MAQQQIPFAACGGNKVSCALVFEDTTGKITGIAVSNTSDREVVVDLNTERLTFPAGQTLTLSVSGQYAVVTTRDGRSLDFRWRFEGPAR